MDTLHSFIRYTDNFQQGNLQALVRGAGLYRDEQFFDSGQSKGRLPRNWLLKFTINHRDLLPLPNLPK